MTSRAWMVLGVGALLLGARARAEEPRAETLYELSTEGSSRQLKPGEQGKFVLSIKTRKGAYVSTEAPLKIELAGTHVLLSKQKLTLADSVGVKLEGQKHAEPRFEVPFQLQSAGTIDAKATFFVCTDTLCMRQEKKLSLAVEAR